MTARFESLAPGTTVAPVNTNSQPQTVWLDVAVDVHQLWSRGRWHGPDQCNANLVRLPTRCAIVSSMRPLPPGRAGEVDRCGFIAHGSPANLCQKHTLA